ncbi:MAG: Flp pilus assembly protein CpaB [Lentisphaerae bacterium GWF2_57_35]|nr:MAG: Flp pilus assembly protein CpaB [Lentisphaerae bacterium GWF2_57_35]
MAIVAILAIRSYVKRVEAEARAKLEGRPVVAAKTDIKAGTEIEVDLVAPKEVPPAFIPPQAIQGSMELKQIVGRKTRVPLRAGQIILWSDLESERHGGLSTLIPEGEGAFTVNIGQGISSSLIQPNDHIDIIASFAIPKGSAPAGGSTASWRQASDMVNVVLLQNVTVLAIGNTMGGPVQSPEEKGGSGPMTLSVTLPEAQLLMFAVQHGELGAMLRKEGAVKTLPREQLPRVTFEAIEKIIGDLDQSRDKRLTQP